MTNPLVKKKISMKEISELTGVSVATVSRVINNNGRFSEETRELVNSAIKKHNYVPNAIARGLRTSTIENIGVIVPDITNEFFSKLTLVIQNHLFQYGYSTLICNTNEINELEQKHLSALEAQNVSGIIYIAGGYSEGEFVRSLAIPTVYVDRRPNFESSEANYVTIESNNEQGGYLAGMELVHAGCKAPIIIRDKRELASQRDRLKGYQDALKEGGVSFSEKNILYAGAIDYDTAYKVLTEYLDAGGETDGIFATTDWLALGALQCLMDRQFAVPEQIKVVGFDDISLAALGSKPLTTVKQDVDRMGTLAADTLMNMIEGVELSEKNKRLPVQLIRRKTT